MKRFLTVASIALLFHGAAAHTAVQRAKPDSDTVVDVAYVVAVKNKLRDNVLYAGPLEVAGNPKVVYRVLSAPDGTVDSVDLVRSSGIPDFDAAVERAIWRASPLPRRSDGKVEQNVVIEYSLKE